MKPRNPNFVLNGINSKIVIDYIVSVIDILDDGNISNFNKREILRRMIKEIVKVKEGSRELKIVFWEN